MHLSIIMILNVLIFINSRHLRKDILSLMIIRKLYGLKLILYCVKNKTSVDSFVLWIFICALLGQRNTAKSLKKMVF